MNEAASDDNDEHKLVWSCLYSAAIAFLVHADVNTHAPRCYTRRYAWGSQRLAPAATIDRIGSNCKAIVLSS